MTVNFFTDYEVPKNFKIAIDGLERNIPARKHSHNAAWVRLYKNMLETAGYENVTILGNHDTYEGYDALIIYLGISYSGTINYFFGVDDNVVRRFARIQDFEGPTFVLNHDMPLIGTSIGSRLENKSTSLKVGQLNLEKLDEICKSTQRIDHVEKTKKLCFGDSHCFSAYKAGYMVCRNDGLTLHSIIRDGAENKIKELSGLDIEEIDELVFYAGNIDIRHHLMRQEDSLSLCHHLAIELTHQLNKLPIDKIEIVQLLPIENESRKLPKTGYYKKTPFYGSWKERTNLVHTFNSAIDKIRLANENFSIFRWPSWFLNEKSELDFEYMERPKSVHLSPLAYRWDLFNNVANPLHNNK